MAFVLCTDVDTCSSKWVVKVRMVNEESDNESECVAYGRGVKVECGMIEWGGGVYGVWSAPFFRRWMTIPYHTDAHGAIPCLKKANNT